MNAAKYGYCCQTSLTVALYSTGGSLLAQGYMNHDVSYLGGYQFKYCCLN